MGRDIRELLAEKAEATAAWKSAQAGLHPQNERYMRGARALTALAAYVRDLPPEDERLLLLELANGLEDVFAAGGRRALTLLYRFGWEGDASRRSDFERFLDSLVEAVWEDEFERVAGA